MVTLSSDDRWTIQDLIVRYGYVVDDRDWPGFAQVFTSDAIVDFRDSGQGLGSGLAPIEGLDEIVRMFRDVLVHPLQHVLANHLVEPISADEAEVRTKALFPISEHRVFEGIYRDIVSRTPDGWRIRYKTIRRFDSAPSPWRTEFLQQVRARGGTLLAED